MESLSSLPPKIDTIKTPEEEMILNQLFSPPPNASVPQQPTANAPPNLPPPPSTHPRLNWKILGVTIALFAVLANPWIDALLSKLPYCGGGFSLTVLKTILFSFFLILANLFL